MAEHDANQHDAIGDNYYAALRRYLDEGGEESLQQAYELGRNMILQGFGVLDLVAVYRDSLVKLMDGSTPGADARELSERALVFFTESLSPFEMTHRGFQETNAKLHELTQDLEARVEERTQALEEREHLSDALNRINLAISSTLDYDQIMRTVTVESAASTGSEAAVIELHENAGWPIRYIHGVPEDMLGRSLSADEPAISKLAVAAKQPVAVGDVMLDARFGPSFFQRQGVRSFFAIPLMVRDEAIGVLILFNSRAVDYSEAQLDFGKKLGANVSLALENSRLYSAERNLAGTLQIANRSLARSNAELQQFAYVASHDLQEPLRMVTSYLQLIEKRYKDRLDANAKEFIGYAVDGAQRMSQLITDLLAYSRVETKPEELSRVDLNEVVGRVLRTLRWRIEEAQAEILMQDLPCVNAVESQMNQLFQNLLANALKFRQPGRPLRITVGCQDCGSEWIISVEDSGIGIEQNQLERIFLIFQRLHLRHEYVGTGIGLAISKRIVEKHGGRIWAESAPEAGSTFFFTLPKPGPNA